EFVQVLQSSAEMVNDGDDEDDNVTNTGLSFPRVNVQALGEAILALGNTGAPGTHTVNLNPNQTMTGIDFGNHRVLGEISGTKWSDLDADGVRDAGEPGIPNWTIYIDRNQN